MHNKHENIEIDFSDREKIVRQSRIEIYDNSHSLKIDEKIFQVVNYSSFGLAIYSNEKFDRNEFFDIKFIIDDFELCNLNLKLIRQELKDNNLWYIAFAIIGQPINTYAATALHETTKILMDFEKKWKESETIPFLLRSKVFEIKEWLEGIQEKIDTLERNTDISDKNEQEFFEESVVQKVNQVFDKRMNSYYIEVSKLLKDSTEDINKEFFNFFRTQLSHIFYQSNYANRAYTKPRGYAGDYEMMNEVYRNQLHGKTLFAKCMQRYFTDNPAGRAVRNRKDYLNNKIFEAIKKSNGKCKILSLASGPAMELQTLLKTVEQKLVENVEFHLIDQDIYALTHAQKQIESICRERKLICKIKYMNLAIKNIIARGLEDKNYDLIYSAGLFDYFTDPVASFAAQKLYSSLSQGGKVVIGNFNTGTPTASMMELVADWYLIYRSPEQLKQLYININGNVIIEAEPEGVNLFAVIDK